MPEYLAPGVYVEETSNGPIAIAGVSTSTAGFVGVATRGPLGPRLVTSCREYERLYGGLTNPADSYLPYAVRGFFENGGRRLFLSRIVGPNSAPARIDINGAVPVGLVSLGPGAFTNRIWVRVMRSSRNQADLDRFRVQVAYFDQAPPLPFVDPTDGNNLRKLERREPDQFEDWDDLSVDPRSPDYAITRLRNSDLVAPVEQVPAVNLGPIPVQPWAPLANGAEGDALTANSYLGDGAADPPTGLQALAQTDEVSILCVPDESKFPDDIRNALVEQCEQLRDRFAILQVEGNQRNAAAINPPFTSSYAAMYYPWLRVSNPRLGENLLVPPGGHIAGVYAGTDIRLGVHEAPANVELRGIITSDLPGNRKPLEYSINRDTQALLNPKGINVCRDFRVDRRGIRVWGARTLSSDAQWKYVNVRRLFIFVEESIDEGIQWVVFRPNSEPTWSQLRRSIAAFLTSVWKSGALVGAKPEEAFFVRCDRTTMSQQEIDNGQLICYVGLAPVKPAEFVILRFSQFTRALENA
jgi:uncharacterized protein